MQSRAECKTRRHNNKVGAEAEEITDDLEITAVIVFSVRHELKPNEEFKNLNITIGKD